MTTPAEAGQARQPRPLIYRVMDAAAADLSLSPTEMLVLFVLTKAADADGTGCFIANHTLALRAHLSTRAVRRHVSKLCKLGYIERRRRRRDSAMTTIVEPQEGTPAAALDTQEGPPVASRPATSGQQTGHQWPTTVPVTDSITDTTRESAHKRAPFTPPTVDQVRAFCRENGYQVDADRFVNYYASIGWLVGGKAKMKDWQAAIRSTWVKGDKRGQAAAEVGRLAAVYTETTTAHPWNPEDVREFSGSNGTLPHPKWDAYMDAMSGRPGMWLRFLEWLGSQEAKSA